MSELFKYNLQLFAEGGEGGGDADGASGEAIPDSVPERARETYKKAMAKHRPVEVKAEVSNTTAKPSYADLIKSDDYKAEHQAYMEKTIGDRLKKYKGVEEQNAQMRNALETVANKYGINAQDENFLQTLAQKIEEDDSYYEEYAIKHNMTPQEARKLVTLERKVQRIDAQREEDEKQARVHQHMVTLHQNAEKTKARFPEFDLDTEMQDEKFRRLCIANNGDTTAAYMACHWDRIIPNTVNMATRQAQAQTVQSIASGKNRPQENGLSSTASSVVTEDFSKMSLKELRAYAEEQRRKAKGR